MSNNIEGLFMCLFHSDEVWNIQRIFFFLKLGCFLIIESSEFFLCSGTSLLLDIWFSHFFPFCGFLKNFWLIAYITIT